MMAYFVVFPICWHIVIVCLLALVVILPVLAFCSFCLLCCNVMYVQCELFTIEVMLYL